MKSLMLVNLKNLELQKYALYNRRNLWLSSTVMLSIYVLSSILRNHFYPWGSIAVGSQNFPGLWGHNYLDKRNQKNFNEYQTNDCI